MTTTEDAPTTGDLLRAPSSVARLNYFFGQLLTQRDLQAEQSYHLLLQRLMQREMMGTGTVAGLRVDEAGPPHPRDVFIRAGLALDPDGRELLLSNDVCVKVAEPPRTEATANPIAGTDAASIASSVQNEWGFPFDEDDFNRLQMELGDAGLTEAQGAATNLRDQLNKVEIPSDPSLDPGVTLRQHLFNQLVGTTYLGLRYLERGAEPSPAVLDASCCGDSTCFPARIEEGVIIVGQADPFPEIADPFAEALLALETCFVEEENPEEGDGLDGPPFFHRCRECLCDYLLEAWRDLPPVHDPCGPPVTPTVPIACIRWSRFAREASAGEDATRILSIDNCGCRPLAPGVPPTRALLQAVTRCASPVAIPPRIEAVEPADGAELVVPAEATSVSVLARVNGRLQIPPSTAWELIFHETPSNGPSNVQRWTGTGPTPNSFDVSLQLQQNDETHVELRLESQDGALNLPAGTYTWRINLPDPQNPDAYTIEAETSDADLDGEPNPPRAVPSGDGIEGGTFEARFFVKPSPSA